MQNMIRFSMFGNYEKFSTNSIEAYLKLISFFGNKGYRPATANELQLQPDGQPRLLVMPIFSNETGAVVELTSNRINFQKNILDINGIEALRDGFMDEFSDLMNAFVADMKITASRVALNCDVLQEGTVADMPIQSSYFDNAEKTEMSVRNVARKKLESEESNIIIEKSVTAQDGIRKFSYDINSIAENQSIRFGEDNIMKICKAYINVALEIEKGLK